MNVVSCGHRKWLSWKFSSSLTAIRHSLQLLVYCTVSRISLFSPRSAGKDVILVNGMLPVNTSRHVSINLASVPFGLRTIMEVVYNRISSLRRYGRSTLSSSIIWCAFIFKALYGSTFWPLRVRSHCLQKGMLTTASSQQYYSFEHMHYGDVKKGLDSSYFF